MLNDMSCVGAFFVLHQMRGEMIAGGEGFGSVVLGMSEMQGMGLRLVVCLGFMAHGIGDVLGVVLLELNGACWFLDLSIRGLLHCFGCFLHGFR